MWGYIITGVVCLAVGLAGGAVLWRILTKGTAVKHMKEELRWALKEKAGEGIEELEKVIDEF